ncbi:MAG: hypothetical protein QM783_18495 [Phycisphaerales bacterium]
MKLSLQHVLSAAMVIACAGAAVKAQDFSLRAEQVLVVYDDRIPDSLAVAEYYVGSAKVPGGAGGLVGSRPGVQVMNLNASGAPLANTPDITYAAFKPSFRTPIRQWLVANDPLGRVRCIVLTKGLAHRVQDSDAPTIGDDPLHNVEELSNGDLTCASVDSELTLLQLNLDLNENGNRGDSFADGMIINPYHNQSLPVNAWNTRQRRNLRQFDWLFTATAGTGVLARSRTIPTVQVLTPGDMFLVCRLDGNTVADVFAMIDRARANVVNTDTAVVMLDDSRSNGIADPAANGELDNDDFSDGVDSYLRIGDDDERTRDQFRADGRFAAANIVYDAGNGPTGFLVGPRIDFGGGTVVNGPVVLVGTDGSNTGGTVPGNAGHDLPLSINWGPMGTYTSIESYNGRGLNGLGPMFNQSQIADALSIAGGATFAIGNVYEPYAMTVPDCEVIGRNFYRGRLSWAETAWSSLPVISWQQIVIGDPLARVVLSCQDIDGDGVWTIEDLYAFEGSGAAARSLDLNRSGTVDDTDRRLLDPSPRPADHVDMAGGQR